MKIYSVVFASFRRRSINCVLQGIGTQQRWNFKSVERAAEAFNIVSRFAFPLLSADVSDLCLFLRVCGHKNCVCDP